MYETWYKMTVMPAKLSGHQSGDQRTGSTHRSIPKSLLWILGEVTGA